MEQTTLKLMVSIDQNRIGYYSRGEMVITDMMFSDSHYKFLDVGELTAELKQCIKAMKGWSIITIRLTDDITYSTYPKAVVICFQILVRFVLSTTRIYRI